jgi:two-component system chemotaxis response regulator CheY
MMENGPTALRALVIDDNAINRMLAIDLLGVHQIEADDALEGTSGLGLLRARHYDLVLLDISMPGLDGEKVCKAIREDPRTRDLFVVAYTAHAFTTEKERIIAAGFDALLVKPVSLKSLTRAIEPVLVCNPDQGR